VRKPWTRWQSSFKVTMPYAGRQLLLNMGPELEAAIDAGKGTSSSPSQSGTLLRRHMAGFYSAVDKCRINRP